MMSDKLLTLNGVLMTSCQVLIRAYNVMEISSIITSLYYQVDKLSKLSG